jgi:hypothetical protein
MANFGVYLYSEPQRKRKTMVYRLLSLDDAGSLWEMQWFFSVSDMATKYPEYVEIFQGSYAEAHDYAENTLKEEGYI